MCCNLILSRSTANVSISTANFSLSSASFSLSSASFSLSSASFSLRRIAVDKLINFTEDENQQELDEDDQLIFKQPKGPVTRRAAR
jgi:hypothetical protein